MANSRRLCHVYHAIFDDKPCVKTNLARRYYRMRVAFYAIPKSNVFY